MSRGRDVRRNRSEQAGIKTDLDRRLSRASLLFALLQALPMISTVIGRLGSSSLSQSKENINPVNAISKQTSDGLRGRGS